MNDPDNKPTRESLLAKVMEELRQREKSTEAIYRTTSGAVARELERLWLLGYDVKVLDMLKDLREHLNRIIAELEQHPLKT